MVFLEHFKEDLSLQLSTNGITKTFGAAPNMRAYCLSSIVPQGQKQTITYTAPPNSFVYIEFSYDDAVTQHNPMNAQITVTNDVNVQPIEMQVLEI